MHPDSWRTHHQPHAIAPARSRDAGTPDRVRRRECRTCAPRYFVAIAEHSRCQPGRPLPHGVSHDGSPGFALFQSAKSNGSRLVSTSVSPCCKFDGSCPDNAPYAANERTEKYTSPSTAYAWPASISRRINTIISGTCPVARGCNGRRQAPQRRIRLVEQPLMPLGHRPPRHPGGRRNVENLVVDVGDVAAQGDVVSVRRKPTNQDVESHRRAHVTDVWWCLHGRAAQI